MYKFRSYSKLSSNENYNTEKTSNKLRLTKSFFIKDNNLSRIIRSCITFLIILIIIIVLFIYMYKYLFKPIHRKENKYGNISENKTENKIESKTEKISENSEVKGKELIKPIKEYDINFINKTKDFEEKTFGIVTREDCSVCGLFSFYSVHLGCIITYLSQGYIPIIDAGSFGSVLNAYNPSEVDNPWEVLFNQPFNYTLAEVKKNAKKIEKLSCSWTNMAPSEGHIYSSWLNLDFHKVMANKFMSVKQEIIDESNNIWKRLFGDTKNVLGVLGRGTDFFNGPAGHSIPPNTEKMIEDVKKMDEKNKYDWIYLATEDDKIRSKFVKQFGNKLKMLQNKNINYDGGCIGDNKNLQGIKFQKLYLLSMLTLSKCLDAVITRCSGGMGVYIFSEGFRESLVYFLGQY